MNNTPGTIIKIKAKKPKVIKSNLITCYDCDDTLVRWIWDESEKEELKDKMLKFDTGGTGFHEQFVWLVPNEEVINHLKQNKATNGTIVVWSKGGWHWANEVVKVLKLQDYVDIIMAKPLKYVDDLPASEWMNYKKVNSDGTLTPVDHDEFS